jgi:hypothetical protein
MMTRRRVLFALLLATLGLTPSACTKIYPERGSPTAPTTTVTPPTPPPPKADQVEFRVLGTNVSTSIPMVVRHTDPINGTTLYVGGVPYFASFTSLDDDVFLYVEASGTGTLATSTLQVQIYVNGRLFREAFSQGFTLTAQASGTFRR